MNRIRMEEAKQLLLLLGDEERIYQVAEQVGCSNARYFGQAFKNIPDRRRQRIFGSIRIKQEETKMDSMRSLQTKNGMVINLDERHYYVSRSLEEKMKDHTALGALRRQLRQFQTETEKNHQFCI